MDTAFKKRYNRDRPWSDGYLPQVVDIIRDTLGETACLPHPDMDVKGNADLAIINGMKTIAVRMRRFGYYDQYPDDFTFRNYKPRGVQSEYEKVMAGFGDLFFYGHGSHDGNAIEHWMLIDLERFRQLVLAGLIKPNRIGNKDGITGFYVCKMQGPALDCLIKRC